MHIYISACEKNLPLAGPLYAHPLYGLKLAHDFYLQNLVQPHTFTYIHVHSPPINLEIYP
jgi:hypothetical protein